MNLYFIFAFVFCLLGIALPLGFPQEPKAFVYTFIFFISAIWFISTGLGALK